MEISHFSKTGLNRAIATAVNTLENESNAGGPSAVNVSESDNGRTIRVPKGTPLAVSLASNPTTGYDWIVVGTNRSFGYPSDTTFAPNSSAVGSGGTKTLTWNTNNPFLQVGSEHTVTLAYARPWALDVPAKTFSFTAQIV